MDHWVIEKDIMVEEYRLIVAFNGECGFRCGYIGIPSGHPLYESRDCDMIQCHGGISYSEDNLNGIVNSNDLWYIGFACGEQCDGIDFNAYKQYFGLDDLIRFVQTNKSLQYHTNNVKTLEYVEDELRAIIKQLKIIQEKEK